MRDLADESAEQHYLFDVHLGEHLGHGAPERLPAQIGLLAENQQQIAIVVPARRGEELGGRPLEAPHSRLVDSDGRPALLEVEELLRIDGRERLVRVGKAQQIVDGTRRRIACVVPSFERDDRPWPAECRFREPPYRVHGRRVATAGASRS